MSTHGKLGQEGHSRALHLAGLNTGRYKSSFTPALIPREILTAQEHKAVVLNSQGLEGQGGVGEWGKHQQISQLIVQQGWCESLLHLIWATTRSQFFWTERKKHVSSALSHHYSTLKTWNMPGCLKSWHMYFSTAEWKQAWTVKSNSRRKVKAKKGIISVSQNTFALSSNESKWLYPVVQ